MFTLFREKKDSSFSLDFFAPFVQRKKSSEEEEEEEEDTDDEKAIFMVQ